MALIFFYFIAFFMIMADYLSLVWAMPLILYLIFFVKGNMFDGFFYIDLVSFSMLFITIWVIFICCLSCNLDFWGYLCMQFMGGLLVFSFSSVSVILFYSSFELVFVFMFFFLLMYGLSLERIQASFYMFFYTLLFSLPFLLMLVFFGSFFTSNHQLLWFMNFSMFFWVFMLFVFAVKLPLYGFHLWLPKAHLEAPVSGSMVLAGVLLKLGGYGMIRFFPSIKMFSFSSSLFSSLIFSIGLLGGLLTSILCVRQMDLKMMIAYSSIVHMSFMVVGLLSFSFFGLTGSILMLVSHAFISPMMFFLMGFLYDGLHTRSLMILKGVGILSSVFPFLWFIVCFLNLSSPPFMSFYSEVIISGCFFMFTFLEWMILFFLCFLSGLFCLFMFSMVFHGRMILSSFFSMPMGSLMSFFFFTCYVLFYPIFLFF